MGNTSRSRWAAIGAAVAVTLGAGGLVGVNAVGSASSLVPINPVRILDTRSSERVGSLDVAGASDPYRLKVAGVSGIPSTGVTGVSLNVTAVDTQSNDYGGFVTVYPCASTSSTRPDVSNLNFRSGQTLANSVTVAVSANGYICFYVYGTAHLLADANGYYTESSSGATVDAYTKAESDARYITEVDAYTKAESDVRYAALGENDIVESVILDRNETSSYSAPAIGLTNAGLPVLAYSKKSVAGANPLFTLDLEMKLMFCGVVSCDAETNTVIDLGLDGAAFPNLKLTGDDVPYITYATTEGNFLTRCSTSDCSGGVSTPITLSDLGVFAHLELDSSDLAGVAWVDALTGDLHFMKCANLDCSSRQSNAVTAGAEKNSSDSIALAIPSSGNPIIAYAGGADYVEVRLIFCNDAFCAGGDESIVTIDADALPENGLDVALSADGLPVVAYVDTDEKVSITVCQNADCSVNTGPKQITAGHQPAIEIDTSGLAHFAFFEKYTTVTEVESGPPVGSQSSSDYRLSAIRCGDAECSWMALDQTWPSLITFLRSSTALTADGALLATSIDFSFNSKLTMLP